MTTDQRTIELLKWESETGARLPMAVSAIVALEEAGHVVDLATGDVLLNEAANPIAVTVFGEAVVVALAVLNF